MKHPQTYLLERIIGSPGNGFKEIRSLNGKYVDDITKMMREFAIETVKEVIDRLNKGEDVFLDEKTAIRWNERKGKRYSRKS